MNDMVAIRDISGLEVAMRDIRALGEAMNEILVLGIKIAIY